MSRTSKPKHTVKSVGLSPAFPFFKGTPGYGQGIEIPLNHGRFFIETGEGMTFFQYLYAKNTASQGYCREIKMGDLPDYFKDRTFAQLKAIAEALNELESMEE